MEDHILKRINYLEKIVYQNNCINFEDKHAIKELICWKAKLEKIKCKCGYETYRYDYLNNHSQYCNQIETHTCKYCGLLVDIRFLYEHTNNLCDKIKKQCNICGDYMLIFMYEKHREKCKYITCIYCNHKIIHYNYDKHIKKKHNYNILNENILSPISPFNSH